MVANPIPTSIQRARVYRYHKSGRLVAVVPGVFVLEMGPDLKTITTVRSQKQINRAMLSATKYVIEVRETITPVNENQNNHSFHLIRVLSSEDLDPNKWLSTISLEELPVSPEAQYWDEELIWAGKRQGNLGTGITLIAAPLVAAASPFWPTWDQGSYTLLAIAAATSAVIAAKYPWNRSKLPDPEKLRELDTHKQNLRHWQDAGHLASRTHFERTLEDFHGWRNLSAERFELALSVRLEKEGYGVKTTQFSKDGGVDIEATDKHGLPMIVQAKKYASKVGVNVVREMIGVRECRTDRPRTMIYSLSGFTRGAKELAQKHGIELRDIRSELTGV